MHIYVGFELLSNQYHQPMAKSLVISNKSNLHVFFSFRHTDLATDTAYEQSTSLFWLG